MNSEEPDVAALAQRMVRAVDDFIAELKHLGVTITGNEMWLLESLPREFAEHVLVRVCGEHQDGTLLSVRVPTAELPRWRERLPDHIAAQFQCSRDDALTFLAWRDHPELIPDIQCNHTGCRNTRTCQSQFLPSDVSTIIKRATSELRILVCLTTCTGIRWPLQDLRLTLAIDEPVPTTPRYHS